MKKLLRHNWGHGRSWPYRHVCIKCGCVKYFDFDYQRIMYQWGTKTTYRPPDCIAVINGQKPYNPELVKSIKSEQK
jgi:hypothetical protein